MNGLIHAASRVAWVCLGLLVVLEGPLAGYTPLAAQSEHGEAGAATTRLGICEHYRVGHWTGVRIDDSIGSRIAGMQTIDGDGVRVSYLGPDPATGDPTTGGRWIYAVPGSDGAPIEWLDRDGQPIGSARFPATAVEPSKPWIVIVGDSLGIEKIGVNDLLNRGSSVAASLIEDADQLPDAAIGWSGVDLLVISPSGLPVLSSMSQRQGRAVTDWIRSGGRVVVSLDDDFDRLRREAPWLASTLPVAVGASALRIDPSALETFTSSQSPLPTLIGTELNARGGRTLIEGRTATRQPTRVAIESIVGFGLVTTVAVPLDSQAMAVWPQRSLLLSRLTDRLPASETAARRETRATAAVEFDDLAGQMRSALDRFDSHRPVAFSIVSLLLLGLVAFLGPIDYLLVNRWLGRPLLGWITFPLSALLLSGLIVFLGMSPGVASPAAGTASTAKSAGITINRLEIIDVDATSSPAIGRGFHWAHVGSRHAMRIPYAPKLSSPLSARDENAPPLTAPFGYPGTTFGGIQIVGENRQMPPYRIVLDRDPHNARNDWGGGPETFPVAPRGSKGFLTQWTFSAQLGQTDGLYRKRGGDLLDGELTNPLAIDLLDGVLVYGNWAYILPTRLRAGQTIPSLSSLRQKNFRWQLSRREALENTTRSEPWNVTMHDDLQRLTEVMMFESMVGGRDYTGLANRPLRPLDLTYLLSPDRAILFGKQSQPSVELPISSERPAVANVRVVLPVGPPRRSIN